MTSEAATQNAVRLEAQRRGVYLWRNNTGVLEDRRGVPVRFGLGNDSSRINAALKSSDLIGIAPDGRFVAIECKPPGWRGARNDRERAQAAFIDLVRRQGGCAGFATCVGDLDRILTPGGTTR
jgi:hypothetical protein